MLVARVGSEVATETDWATWESNVKAPRTEFSPTERSNNFLEPTCISPHIHTSANTASSARDSSARSTQVTEEIQVHPESQNGYQPSTAEILCPQDVISRVPHSGRILLTATPPMMSELFHQNDVPQDLDSPYEMFEIEQMAYYDMVTDEILPSETPFEKTDERPFCDPNDDDNPVFQTLRHNRRNLVLDSVSPHLAPHIVITPPTASWDPFEIPWHNQINQQSLMVQQNSQSAFTQLPPAGESSFDPYYFESCPSDSDSSLPIIVGPCRPKAVFNRARFTQSIESSSTERLILYHVTTALQKLLCKASAFTASDIAQSFRKRYDCPDFVLALEKPFKWSDPAEPLLQASTHLLGTTVIDSVCPWNVPHIVISEPAPQSPWIAWNNATNDPQDCGYGAYLTVPSRLVSFVNFSSTASWPDNDEADAFQGHDDEDHQEESCCSSPLDTPAPDTPIFGIDHEEVSFFLGDYSEFSPDSDCPGGPISALGRHCTTCPMVRPSCDIFARGRGGGDDEDDDDDDGDDLPPFDDWYLSIVERTKNRLSS